MNRTLLGGTAVTLALLIAACGSNEGAQNAQNDAQDANAMMADPSNPFAQAEMQMHERMMAAKGANLSETWIKKMIEHHRGAVDMSNVLIAQGGDPKALELARMTARKQQQEIEELERMLGGEAPAAAASAAPARAPSVAEKPQPKAQARAAPKPAPKAAPPAPPKAEPKPPAAPTCTPEHRAAGHC